MSLTKIDITESIREKFGLPKKDCAGIVESLFDIIKDDLNIGDDVMISGFGKWTVKAKKARKGRNPQTGADLTIAARRVVTFKPSNVEGRREFSGLMEPQWLSYLTPKKSSASRTC